MANPTFESIRVAIESRLVSWDGVPVEMDGYSANKMTKTEALPMAIANKEPWVRCTIQHGDSFAASISNQPETRRVGLLQFQAFTPENRGSRPAALIADSLAAHFEYWYQGNLTMQAASVQRIGPDSGWYQYNVSIPFAAGC